MSDGTVLSVEVRGRQRVRNVALGIAAGLLTVTVLAVWTRTWDAPSPASCLRARQVVQAAGLASVAALVLLGLRALELVLLPRDHDPDRKSRARWAGGAGILGLLAAAAATTGVGLTVADTLRTPDGTVTCYGTAVGAGTGANLFAAGLLVLLGLDCGLVVWSAVDLPPGEHPTGDAWRRKHRDAGTAGAPPAPAGTVICCSGGGIRSAAFCLGGLQALDATPAPDQDPLVSIYAYAREVIGVSGGGYMAAAWHVARHPKPAGQAPPSRRRRWFGGGVPAAGEGGRRGTALAGSPAANGHAPAGTPLPQEHLPQETLTLDEQARRRPFGAASPEVRRLRRTTAYLASSGRVRADAVLSWFFGTALMWAVALAGIGVTAWVLSLFVDRLQLATGLDGADATAWPPRPLAAIVSALVVALGPALFFGRRILQMRQRRDARTGLPDRVQNVVLPAIAAGTIVTALLIGVPGVAVLLHDTTVRNQPVPLVANIVHTLGYAPPSACEAATNDGTFTRLYQQEQARAQAAGHPVTFSFGACGSEVEVSADPKVDVGTVSPAALEALTFAPGVWQQLAASGAALALLGGLVRSMLKGRSPQQPTGRGGGAITFLRRRVAPWLATVLVLAAGFLLLVKWLDDDLLSLRQGGTDFVNGYWPPLFFLTLLLALKVGTSATWMSMHPFYRDRLRSTYLLRRTGEGDQTRVEPVEDRDLEFNDHDGRPDLVLCGTANLSDDELVPSGRQGAPFLFSARTIGFDDPFNLPPGGAVDGATYADTTRDVRISAAIAISGAALAPVMGRENTNVRPFRLVMALCNVRTGVWLPNPYWVGSISRGRTGGRVQRVVTRLGQATGVPGVGAVLREGIGRTSLMSRSVYVTDGGQLENLGLVVALRRRPATVYVLDASGDLPNTFSTLAQAMAMARIDSGVEFQGLQLAPLVIDDKGYSSSASSGATIVYDDGSTGRLVYVKALVPRDLTWDVEGYRKLDPAFPMTGTEDQLYGEFDFEAYRELGWSVTKAALDARLDVEPPKGSVGQQRSPADEPLSGPSSP